MTPECDNRRFFGLGQNRRVRLFRTRLEILNRRPLSPLGDRLRIDAEFLAPRRERSLPLSARQAAIAGQRIAPSNRGIKHLGYGAF